MGMGRMSRARALGTAMIAAPFLALATAMVATTGWLSVLVIFGGVMLLVAWISIAVWLAIE